MMQNPKMLAQKQHKNNEIEIEERNTCVFVLSSSEILYQYARECDQNKQNTNQNEDHIYDMT